MFWVLLALLLSISPAQTSAGTDVSILLVTAPTAITELDLEITRSSSPTYPAGRNLCGSALRPHKSTESGMTKVRSETAEARVIASSTAATISAETSAESARHAPWMSRRFFR